MIAVSSKGQSFATLARYLVAGRSGEERDRVAWTTARNLPTDDPELAGKIMRATAEQSARVEQPVYHLVLSFDPSDPVDRAAMERVADRVLARLQLHEHEAVYVSHRDREHPHMHLLVNRVHPETGRAWEMSYDYRAIQEILREEERALGLREVPGRYERSNQIEGERGDGRGADRGDSQGGDGPAGAPPERRAVAPREERRTAEPDFVARVRTHVPALRAAPSWAELEAVLAHRGLRLERERRILTIADDQEHVTASRVAPDLAIGRLEARFGVKYEAYLAEREQVIERAGGRILDDLRPRLESPSRGRADVGLVPTIPLAAAPERSPNGAAGEGSAAAMLARQLETYEHVSALFGEHYAATHALSAARARLAQIEAAEARAMVAGANFERALAGVYRDPGAARGAFDRAAVERGIDEAARTMREQPERYGALLTVEQRRVFGIVRAEDDGPARRAALSVATQGREAWFARAGVTTPAEAAEARATSPRAVAREREAREALRRHPEKSLLEREIGRAMRQLLPHEIEELRRLVSSPRFALAVKLREAVKDMAIGREGREQ